MKYHRHRSEWVLHITGFFLVHLRHKTSWIPKMSTRSFFSTFSRTRNERFYKAYRIILTCSDIILFCLSTIVTMSMCLLGLAGRRDSDICPNMLKTIRLNSTCLIFFFAERGNIVHSTESGPFVNKINSHLVFFVPLCVCVCWKQCFVILVWNVTEGFSCLWNTYASHLISFLCCISDVMTGISIRFGAEIQRTC